MKIFCCGTDFPHEKGEFCVRSVRNSYFLSYFSTPFLYERDGEILSGNAGEVLLMPPGTMIYHGPRTSDECFMNDWIYLDGAEFRNLLNRYHLPQNAAFRMEDSFLLKKCIETVEEERLLRHVGYEEVINCAVTNMVIQMHRLHERQKNMHSPIRRVEEVRESFLRRPDQEWSLKKMADLAEYSVSRFCTLYQRKYGGSPIADLLNHRLNLAKQLLVYNEYTITEISERCGFKSIYYFSKYFKEKEGCMPSEYRRRNTSESCSF